jgi:hypothetical protein
VSATGDYGADGRSDVLWRESGGALAMWIMKAGTVTSIAGLGNVSANWVVQSVNAN